MALRKVVLPVLVPPEIRIVLRARIAARRKAIGSACGSGMSASLRLRQRAGIIGVERQVEPAVAADRHGPVLARGGRAAELDARAVGQGRAEQRMLAVDALVADARDLFGEALDQPVVDLAALRCAACRAGAHPRSTLSPGRLTRISVTVSRSSHWRNGAR